jgi:hypothetical protein
LKLNLCLHIVAGLMIGGAIGMPWTTFDREFSINQKEKEETDKVFLFSLQSIRSSEFYFFVKMMTLKNCKEEFEEQVSDDTCNRVKLYFFAGLATFIIDCVGFFFLFLSCGFIL